MHATPEFDVFVSYNTLDHLAVERIARALEERELKVFLDRWELVPGRPWPDALEEHLSRCRSTAVVLGPSGMGPWQQREHYLALDRQAQDTSFGVIPVLLPNADPALGFLSLNTWVDLRSGVDDAQSIDLLAAAVRGESPKALLEGTRRTVAEICPYRGLEVFREEDAAFFCGREDFTKKLREAVAGKSLVAVVGASGSGKSSVVRAGLIPSLRRPDGGAVWEVVTLVPGQQPLHALIGALLPLLEPEMTEIDQLVEVNKRAENFIKGELHLHQVIDRVIKKQSGTDRLLLVVDQWEELYTYARDEKAKETSACFVDELLTAVDTVALTVVLTLRADFYGEVLSHRTLSDRLQTAQVNLGPMTRKELARAVTEPAQKVGLNFEPGLVDRLLDDVGNEPGNLPLLEFALKELWSARRGSQLLHEVYKAMKGVKGAIAQRAEHVYTNLDPSQKKTAERVFTRLVRPGDETGDTRCRAELREFDQVGQDLVRKLAGPAARLLITGRDTGTNQETVEVAHEALIREWEQMQTWVGKVRKQLKDQSLMEDLAHHWEEHEGGLASGRQLKDFKHAGATTKQAKSFLEASLKHQRNFWLGTFVSVIVLLGGLYGLGRGFGGWVDDLGISPYRGAELLLYRAGIDHPTWIPEMVSIESGSFMMGSANKTVADHDPNADTGEFTQHKVAIPDPRAKDFEYPQHKVTIKEFNIGKYEITFEQYCASTKHTCPDDHDRGRGKLPVTFVNLNNVYVYIQWLNKATGQSFRLPTEAEWEYAARAGTQGRHWWCGESEPNCDLQPDVANCSGCETTKGLERIGEQTLPVGSFQENPFGLYDTAGNVSEWVQDCWHHGYKEAPQDGSAWLEADGGQCGDNVYRSGSYTVGPGRLRSAFRYWWGSTTRSDDLGFRLAQDL